MSNIIDLEKIRNKRNTEEVGGDLDDIFANGQLINSLLSHFTDLCSGDALDFIYLVGVRSNNIASIVSSSHMYDNRTGTRTDNTRLFELECLKAVIESQIESITQKGEP